MDQWQDVSVEDYVRLRKFRTVQQFVAGTHRLDEVLENIESFSHEARRLNREI